MGAAAAYGTRVFVRHELGEGDEAFAQHGGIYHPYATQQEAERQAAWDLELGGRPAELIKAGYGPHSDLHLAEDRRVLRNLKRGFATDARAHVRAILEAQQRAQEDELLALHKAALEGRSDVRNVVPGNAYRVVTGGTATAGATALSAATAKTVVGVQAGTVNQPSFVQATLSFDGVTATAVPVLCEWVMGTGATNGTLTTMTPKQVRGWPAQTSQITTAGTGYAWSAEPTTLEVFDKLYLSPYGGMYVIQWPLGREPTGIITASTQGKFVGIRLTAPATVNCHASLEYEE